MQLEHEPHHDVGIKLGPPVPKDQLLPPDYLLDHRLVAEIDAQRIVESNRAVGCDVILLYQVVRINQVVNQPDYQTGVPYQYCHELPHTEQTPGPESK